MRASVSLLCLAVLATSASALGQEPDRDQTAAEVAALRHRLGEEPNDVDARLALALRLSWLGEISESEREVAIVIETAPEYWDAHLLAARLAAWTGRFDEARAKVGVVIRRAPSNVPARELAVDIELWADRASAAAARADELLAVDDSAESRFRAARAAELSMRTLETRRLARRTLALDPKHQGAKSLLATVNRARFIGVTELEVFPIDENAVALGQLVSATIFPSSAWSATVGYDFRRRFGTDNHRATVGVAHRINRHLSADAWLRGGSAEVVAELSGSVGARARVKQHYSLSVHYLGDKMPWPGQLHRVSVGLGAGLPGGFELGAVYEAGALRYCGETDPVQSLSLRSQLGRGRFRAGLLYGFGMELDRAPLPPFVADRFGDDVCAAEGEDGIDISLRDTRAQLGGGHIGYEKLGSYAIRAGYTLIYRLTDEVVHVSFLSLNLWL